MPRVTWWLACAGAAAFPAYADLYRWVDPQSGSIKYSSSPPAWVLDGARGPAVQVIPYRRQGAPAPAPAPEAAAATPSPLTAALDERRRSLLRELAAVPERPGAERIAAIQEKLIDYESVVTELEERDPAGVARRRNEDAKTLGRLREVLEAQAREGSGARQ